MAGAEWHDVVRLPRGRRVAAASLVAATCCSVAVVAVAAPARPAWHPRIGSAVVYARHRHGIVAFAVCTPARCRGRQARRTFPSASLLKPMLLVAYLDRPTVRHRRLRRRDGALLGPMIRRSDDVAATRVLAIVGLPRLRALAHRARMRRFTPVARPWGLSRIDAIDQARFFLHIGRLLPRRHRTYALRLLGHIIGPQRWGIAQVAPPGWRLYFKGGWGSGTGRVDHQTALLVRGPRRVALSILTYGDGTHRYGKATLRGVAARLLRGL